MGLTTIAPVYVTGPAGVGKTTLITLLENDRFLLRLATSGGRTRIAVPLIEAVPPAAAMGLILVYNICDASSFDSCKFLAQKLLGESADEKFRVRGLIGTHRDMSGVGASREVSYSAGESLARAYGMVWMEISAAEASNAKLFRNLFSLTLIQAVQVWLGEGPAQGLESASRSEEAIPRAARELALLLSGVKYLEPAAADRVLQEVQRGFGLPLLFEAPMFVTDTVEVISAQETPFPVTEPPESGPTAQEVEVPVIQAVQVAPEMQAPPSQYQEETRPLVKTLPESAGQRRERPDLEAYNRQTDSSRSSIPTDAISRADQSQAKPISPVSSVSRSLRRSDLSTTQKHTNQAVGLQITTLSSHVSLHELTAGPAPSSSNSVQIIGAAVPTFTTTLEDIISLYAQAFPPERSPKPPRISETITPHSGVGATEKPVIFIEVEIGDRVETLCAAKTDNAFQRASEFVSRHNLSRESVRPLTKLLQARIDEYSAMESRGALFAEGYKVTESPCQKAGPAPLSRPKARPQPVIAELSVPVASKGNITLQLRQGEDPREAARSFSVLYGLRPSAAEALLLAVQKQAAEYYLQEASRIDAGAEGVG